MMGMVTAGPYVGYYHTFELYRSYAQQIIVDDIFHIRKQLGPLAVLFYPSREKLQGRFNQYGDSTEINEFKHFLTFKNLFL